GGDNSTSEGIKRTLSVKEEKERSFEMRHQWRKGVKDMLADEEKWPRELIFIGRNMRIVQGNNQYLGAPVNRIKIMGNWASRSLVDSPDLSYGEKLINLGRHFLFKFVLFSTDVVFYTSKVAQFFGRKQNVEDDMEASIKKFAGDMGFEVNHSQQLPKLYTGISQDTMLTNRMQDITQKLHHTFPNALHNHDQNSKFLHEVLPIGPHPGSLAIDVHWNGSQQAGELNTSDSLEHSLRPRRLEPVVEEQREDQAVEDVLGEIEGDQALSSVHPVRVHSKGDRCCRAERTAEADDAEEDSGHDPFVLLFGTPTKAHETGNSGNRDRESHDQAELWLIHTSVPSAHRFDDDVADFASHSRTEYTSDERRYVDQSDTQGREAVLVTAIDMGH
ncbi:MAG: hypothetical protein Q9174_006865, partial [Haloplaca sp. 1 TL-2023]